jgi:hypothetical protein
MSKPASGCEFSTRTPTVKVEPRVTGIFAGPVEQGMAAAGEVMQTTATTLTKAPWTFSGSVTPTAVATSTQVFRGEDTLLVAQPGAVGKNREVIGVDAVTLYVTVKARPEQGAIPAHSLVPELSIVEASTTPGPLAAPAVHVPFWAEPLTQKVVNVGLEIRRPRAALTGLKNAGLAAT